MAWVRSWYIVIVVSSGKGAGSSRSFFRDSELKCEMRAFSLKGAIASLEFRNVFGDMLDKSEPLGGGVSLQVREVMLEEV